MGSVSNSLASTLSGISNPVSVEGTTSSGGIFTGTSQYSQDFQSVINREVTIASLPIQQLQNQQLSVQSQSSALSTLSSDFTSLQSAVAGIGDALGGASYSASISNPAVVSASLSNGATQGVYNISVTSIGSYQTSLSTTTWNSSGSTPNTYTLVVGSNSYQFTPADNSAASVAAAINSQFGNLVEATAVNVGSNSSPDERISLQSTTLGPTTLDLQLNGNGLQTQQNTGTLAQYQVNNSGITVTSNTPSVTISNGVSLNLLATGIANVTVTRPTSGVANALSTFVSAYNQCAKDLTAQRGQSGGALQGQNIVNELSQALSSISSYLNPGGEINALASLGITLDTTGQMSFDPLSFAGTDLGSSSAVNAFLGSATGGGFLESAANTLSSLLDPNTGLVPGQQSSYQSQLTRIGNEISTDQAKVSQLQTQLESQLAKSDAAIAGKIQQLIAGSC